MGTPARRKICHHIQQTTLLYSLLLLGALVLLQGCASTEELFAEYDDKFCVVPEYPSQVFRWEPVVYFDSDSSLVQERSLTKLQANVATLTKLTGYKISLQGFADHQGNDSYNDALSDRRVKACLLYTSDAADE